MGDNADSHQLLSVVAAVHHERVGETLNDGAVGLAEALDGIATSRVGDVDGRSDLDVVAAKHNSISLQDALSDVMFFFSYVDKQFPKCSPAAWLQCLAHFAQRHCSAAQQSGENEKFAKSIRKKGAPLRQGDVADLDILVGPLVEQLDGADLRGHVLGEHRGLDGLNFDFTVVRHFGWELALGKCV